MPRAEDVPLISNLGSEFQVRAASHNCCPVAIATFVQMNLGTPHKAHPHMCPHVSNCASLAALSLGTSKAKRVIYCVVSTSAYVAIASLAFFQPCYSVQLKPINFFNALASLDVVDNDDFTPCMPKQGAVQFDYSWSTSGNNYQVQTALSCAIKHEENPPVISLCSRSGIASDCQWVRNQSRKISVAAYVPQVWHKVVNRTASGQGTGAV